MKAKVVGCKFVVASCDMPILLNLVEEALDQITNAVEMGLKQVVFCGHSQCSVAAGWQAGNRGLLVPESRVKNATEPTDRLDVAAELPAYKRASQTWVVEQMLRAEAYLADRSCSQDVDITVHALWFDEDQRQIFAYAHDQRRFVLMNRRDIQRLIALLSADQEAV